MNTDHVMRWRWFLWNAATCRRFLACLASRSLTKSGDKSPHSKARCCAAIVAFSMTIAVCVAAMVRGDDYVPNGAGGGAMPFAPLGPAPNFLNNGYGVVPGPPTQPSQPIRPASWPGGSPAPQMDPQNQARPPYAALPVAGPYPGPQYPSPQYAGPAVRGPLGVSDAMPCEGSQILARVGGDVVLAIDVLSAAGEVIEHNKDRFKPEEMDAQRQKLVADLSGAINELITQNGRSGSSADLDPGKRSMIQQLLRQQIETKLIFQDAQRTIPEESMKNVQETLGRQFEQSELKKLLKRENAVSREELEWKLRARGDSLEREKRTYMQRTLSQQWVREKLKIDEEITHEEMLAYYQAHLKEFEKPARARWEELMVRFAKYPSKAEAFAALAALGNQVLMAGAPLAEVAKRGSDGSTAGDGGAYPWTSKGSLACEELDRALFALPVGQLSPIIEGAAGFHILRVTEREEITRKPFAAAQVEIKDKIRNERTKKQLQEYVTRLRKDFPVWTILDEPGAVRPAS
ncbi:MAG: peptidyl-prolyl cis-trans isomerase [Thermoguttaceae bacterium]